MEEETHSSAVGEFCSITGATPDQASFFLESSNWNLETAVSNYFENPQFEGDGRAHSGQSRAVAIEGDENDVEEGEEVQRVVRQGEGSSASLGNEFPALGAHSNSAPKLGRSKQKSKSSNSRIKTFSDLSKKDESDDEEDGPNEYYTGGEKSGMMVQDPNRPGRSNVNIDSIFDRARMHGAREGTSEDLERSPSNTKKPFSGTGRTLAGSNVETPGLAAAQDPTQAIRHTITFWRNGFTVGDGPLRQLNDPANAEFLSSINKGECPRELLPPSRTTPIEVSLVRRDEDWKAPPKPKYVAFSGSGMTLGGSSSTTEPSPSSTPPPPTTNSSSQSADFVLDDSKPTTSIQIRLADGTRLVAKFNHDHTVADIHRFIVRSRPGQSPDMRLQVGFPPKTLHDLSQTIEDAGLKNSVVLQK